MPKMFFAPNGYPIVSTSAVSFNSPHVKVDEASGTADLGSFDDRHR